MKIKNVIFDLGGVIMDIDYKKTEEEFRQLGALNFNSVYTQNRQDHFFDDFEIGIISPGAFRDILQKKLDVKITDEKFDYAWNAMLLDIPQERLDFIKNLGDKYKIFLFSNTNAIHLKEVFKICQNKNGFNTFDGYFEKEYYSHIFGKRKPNINSFISILEENRIEACETLFIDDSIQHIFGAKAAGLHAVHVSSEKSIFDTTAFIDKINNSVK